MNSLTHIGNHNKSGLSNTATMNVSFTRRHKQTISKKSHIELKKRLESIDKDNIDILGSLIENEEEYQRGNTK